jgi:hypothetical protein
MDNFIAANPKHDRANKLLRLSIHQKLDHPIRLIPFEGA